MSGNAAKALQAKIKAIPDGELAETARRAGIDPTALLRIKRTGQDVRLSTLERLAVGFGMPLSKLLDEIVPPPAPVAAPRQVSAKSVRRLLRDVERLAEDARAVAAQLPDEE